MSARSVKQLLASYPRTPPPLTEAHRERYLLDYQLIREGRTATTSLTQRLEGWMHRKVAARQRPGESILELGAGTLNHVKYERLAKRYDIAEPFRELWQDSPRLARISQCYTTIHEVPGDLRYDRIFSIAVLEHLADLPGALATSARLLQPGGLFQAGIPTEGGFLWGAAWRCVTGPAYRLRTGLDYGTLMRHEHINTAEEVVTLIRHFFARVTLARFPLPAHHLSFYTYIEATEPRI